ncbi:hypothetical protein HKBW3S34_02174, partial [Candidatus Hakubella thermalkaliphila]
SPHKKEEKGKIGQETPVGPIIHFHNYLPSQTASKSLIGQGGVYISIQKDYIPLLQSRSHNFCNMLGPAGRKEKSLCHRTHLLEIRVFEDFPYPFPDNSTAGLPGNNYLIAFFPKIFLEKLDLGAFSCSI